MLPEDASQADVYQAAVRSIVDDVMQGFNGTVMAYGQVSLITIDDGFWFLR